MHVYCAVLDVFVSILRLFLSVPMCYKKSSPIHDEIVAAIHVLMGIQKSLDLF